ncbi:NUDIX hydrolase [Gordonia malaquae]|uniref:NUDIX hydrolase n=1 Tax=Gordonia malaquae TaxID=410332 RepID=UPI0030C7937F
MVGSIIAWAGSAVGIVVVLCVIWFAVLSSTRATRIRLLSERVTLARGALTAALDRRVDVARRIAVAGGSETTTLRAAVDIPHGSDPVERESAENRLSSALALTDLPGEASSLVGELSDAQTRVTMARRFYNDAVRDTRALRGRRMVRWLRLGGGGPMPAYFEIAEGVARVTDPA